MNISVLGEQAGAEVTGLDLRHPLAAADLRDLREALVKHIALVFRDQQLTRDQYADAIRNFGEPVPQNFIDEGDLSAQG